MERFIEFVQAIPQAPVDVSGFIWLFLLAAIVAGLLILGISSKKNRPLCERCKYFCGNNERSTIACSNFSKKRIFRRRRDLCPLYNWLTQRERQIIEDDLASASSRRNDTDFRDEPTPNRRKWFSLECDARPLIFGILLGAIFTFISVLGSEIVYELRNGVKLPYKHTNIESHIGQADCNLCGSGDKLTALWGEKNIGVVQLRTFESINLSINSYTDQGDTSRKPFFSHVVLPPRGEGSAVYALIDGRYAYITVKLHDESVLSTDALADYLCTDCLNGFMSKLRYKEQHLDVALINYETRVMEPIEINRKNSFGEDYFIVNQQERDEGVIQLIIGYMNGR